MPRMKSEKKPNSDRENEVRVKLSDEEKNAFTTEAQKLGVGLSTWMRLKLRQVVGLAN